MHGLQAEGKPEFQVMVRLRYGVDPRLDLQGEKPAGPAGGGEPFPGIHACMKHEETGVGSPFGDLRMAESR